VHAMLTLNGMLCVLKTKEPMSPPDLMMIRCNHFQWLVRSSCQRDTVVLFGERLFAYPALKMRCTLWTFGFSSALQDPRSFLTLIDPAFCILRALYYTTYLLKKNTIRLTCSEELEKTKQNDWKAEWLALPNELETGGKTGFREAP
jgi:hypothetical protein